MSNRIAPKMAATIVAAAILAACSGGTAESANNDTAEAVANEAASEAAAANDAAPVATPAAAPAGLGPDFMVGKWSAMNEDCSDTLEFRKDGSVATPFGEGKWTLAGDQLSVDFGEGSKMDPSTIKALSQDRIEISKKSGGKETQKRC
ncbi:MAG: hypothetical protein ABIS39_02640 [Sphingomicrobium sp.]